MTDVEVRLSGPMFDQRYDAVVAEFIDAAKADIADVGLNFMHFSTEAFKRPTGYWESQLRTDRQGDDIVVHDDVVYNAWLEGVGSRNASTRFKGYRIWRRSTQKLRMLAPSIAERTLGRYIGRLQ